jgi:His/Glu/Gln/Arg/opine family amino acid ABC transporter permease subunit
MQPYIVWVSANGLSYLSAMGWTAVIALVSALGSIVWGCILLFARLTTGRWGVRAVDAYVQVFRNTPVLLPIYFIYFGLPLFGPSWPAAVCGGLALVLQNGAYISEVLRGSFNAIDRVQYDAAKSIGLSRWNTFRKVTLPQVLVYSIPALVNQVVLLLKDTSLLSSIAVVELTMQAKLLTERTGTAYGPILVTAALYLVLVSVTEMLFRMAHRTVKWR